MGGSSQFKRKSKERKKDYTMISIQVKLSDRVASRLIRKGNEDTFDRMLIS